MLVEKTIIEFCDEVDSNSPAPGGGSVSALASTLGICLTRMYAHLSIGKKKFKALEENIQNEFIKNFEEVEKYRKELTICIDEDTKAYDEVMKAYKDKENVNREENIYKATLNATNSPYRIMELSLKAMHLCKDFLPYGNQNALSDLACGFLLLEAGIQGANLNVLINIPSLNEKDQLYFKEKSEKIVKEATALKEAIVTEVKNRL